MNTKVGLLNGKRGLITGIANNRSIAYAVADLLSKHGASLVLSYQGERLKERLEDAAHDIGADCIYECDVTKSDSVIELFKNIKDRWGGLDFILHAIAYADVAALKGRYVDTSLEHFTEALSISCYSLNILAKHSLPLMRGKQSETSSILAMSYYGANKVIPSYNVMGVAKAALESSVRYLAEDIGKDGIRVNALSAGPIKTLSGSAISGFSYLLKAYSDICPLRRRLEGTDVAKSALYLLSDLSSGVTGEVHFVDCGYNIIGASIPKSDIYKS